MYWMYIYIYIYISWTYLDIYETLSSHELQYTSLAEALALCCQLMSSDDEKIRFVSGDTGVPVTRLPGDLLRGEYERHQSNTFRQFSTHQPTHPSTWSTNHDLPHKPASTCKASHLHSKMTWPQPHLCPSLSQPRRRAAASTCLTPTTMAS